MKNKIEFVSVVRRYEYEASAFVEGVGKVIRHVIVFENKTDKEVDVYVQLVGNYSNYYLKAATLKEGADVDLSNAVYDVVKFENSNSFETDTSLKDLLCEKRYIA